MHAFTKYCVEVVMKVAPEVKQVIYFSDGASSQLKIEITSTIVTKCLILRLSGIFFHHTAKMCVIELVVPQKEH